MNKASGGDGILVELFEILKCDAVKVLHSICQQIWKTQQWPQDWKRSVFIPIPKKSNAKDYSNYCTIALISHTTKVMLKILQARLQQYMNHELPDVQSGFRKSRGTRGQIANIHWIIEKAREFQKKKKPIYFSFIDYTKAFNCADHNKLWKILQEMVWYSHLLKNFPQFVVIHSQRLWCSQWSRSRCFSPLQYSGLKNSMDCPWCHKEPNMTDWLSLSIQYKKRCHQKYKTAREKRVELL